MDSGDSNYGLGGYVWPDEEPKTDYDIVQKPAGNKVQQSAPTEKPNFAHVHFGNAHKLQDFGIPFVVSFQYDERLSLYENVLALADEVCKIDEYITTQLEGDINDAVLAAWTPLKNQVESTLYLINQALNEGIQNMYNQLKQFELEHNTLWEIWEKQQTVRYNEMRVDIDTYKLQETKARKEFELKINNASEETKAFAKNILKECITLIDSFHNMSEDEFNQFVSEADKKFADLRQELIDLTGQRNGDNILVTNFVTGQASSLQQALYSLYDLYDKQLMIRAKQYDDLQITAQEYDDLQITAQEYDKRAILWLKKYFFYKPFYDYVDQKVAEIQQMIDEIKDELVMWSPIAGKEEPLKDVINELISLHKTEAYQAQEWDDQNVGAKTYDDKSVTAFNYDFDGKNQIPPTE